MTPIAIVMMLVATVIVWGGLIVATVFLMKHPLSQEAHPHDDHDFDQHPV